MRHAKSSWSSGASTDHERPLNERGRRDAPRVARRLSELGLQPQHIVSSDAHRTRETCALMLDVWEDGIIVEFLSKLYLAGLNEFQDALDDVSEEVDTLLAVGHNPGWEHLVHHLSSVSVTMKTATAAILSTQCEHWGEVVKPDWELLDTISPSEL